MSYVSRAWTAACLAALLSTAAPAQEGPATRPAATQGAGPATAQPAVGETVETPSGLKYVIEKPGQGKPAGPGDFVQVHYVGTLSGGSMHGRKFDSSRDRGRPITFQIGQGQVIKGWEEGITGMREGEQRTLLIPAELAYGQRGAPGRIPPDQELHFSVELVRVMPGLEVEVEQEGTGEPAKPGDIAVIHYTGTLASGAGEGTEFDSSRSRGQPLRVAMGAGQVIPGLERGLVGMKEGGKRTVVIPPHLAYGEEGLLGGPIPPNATLKFDVEMVDLEPGLRYTIKKEGQGEVAERGKPVRVHYTGMLHGGSRDGEVFDSSRERGEPFAFTLGAGQVIKGWDVGVEGMKVGEQRTLIIPPEWGYGTSGAGEKIPPNATLRFDVELLGVGR